MNQVSCVSVQFVYTYKAAELLGVTPRMVRCLMKQGKLTGYRRGRRLLMFERREVVELKADRDCRKGCRDGLV